MPAKELQAIVEAYALAQGRGEPAALVSVVQTAGSTYRRPGARMFVDAAGGTVGSISGGCLEDDARERALAVIASGQAALVRYDTTADGDIVWGSGLGCNGVVQVLIEPLLANDGLAIESAGTASPLACIAQALRERRAGALASVFKAEKDEGRRLKDEGGGRKAEGGGQKQISSVAAGDFLWLPDGDGVASPPVTNIADAALLVALRAEALAALAEQRARTRVYALAGGGRAEVFIDFISPPRSLLIFGAGHDAAPLVRLAKELGWRVRVTDGRKAYASPERFPEADEVTHCPPRAVAERLPIEPGEAAVVMTHNYLRDLDILRALLGSPAGYIGLLGPKRRKERLLADLAAEDGTDARLLRKESLRRVHGPAGLDIGAEAPEQIALSILAEIEATGARRRGGPLKRRQGPLHEAVPTAAEGAKIAGTKREDAIIGSV